MVPRKARSAVDSRCRSARRRPGPAYDTGSANTLALQYAGKNGGGLSGSDITISKGTGANDTIKVHVRGNANGVFAKLFGVDRVSVGATATARSSLMQSAQFVAPIGVNIKHPKLKGTPGCPCFGAGNMTTLPLGKNGAPGSFDLLNIDGSKGGTGGQTIADWILHGFDKYLGLGKYRSDPGAKFSSNNIQSALENRLDTVLLFPVYKTLDGQGQNAQYEIIGWIGFHLTSYEVHGNNATLHGYFTQFIAQGILTGSGNGTSGPPNSSTWGVKSIQLIE